ncbi:oxidoreductase [Paenibacillus baekrokdamisoli]|uniref:Oxidoreductase n=1 Tax=Paenibacillus baekrokdamisoli TaxID=1712516 RepID=A0A3G9JEV5_9BACL|nr:Gfo/Idh/MocA family oxidoreductase [Paenibacillus baekrokdamisoli]MBB3073049.1 putative dehydrogenase [Paenibacillus baekrokdamisoli]BBH21714.1 oxidoreductase [Paenibacillus baekrokdamisoli]
MKAITALLLGAGSRGNFIYGPYAEKYPNDLTFVAVAEPDPHRRAAFATLHGIASEQSFVSWEQALALGKIADAVIVSTQDRMHFEPAMKALELGYHVILEKPMSTLPEECISLEAAASKYGRLLMVSHVLRYSPFWAGIKNVIAEGKIGQITSIQLTENVGHQHMAHSYVRGHWRNTALSSPIILAKSCHDLDLISWLMDQDCTRVSSFGSLMHFREDQAPAGSAARCTDGCSVEKNCPYSAIKIYLETTEPNYARYISNEPTPANILQALKDGPYGRCVYHCDNDVVDHQIVNMEFEDGANATFTLSGFTRHIARTVQIMGTHGEIQGNMEEGCFRTYHFASGQCISHQFDITHDGHGGGDNHFVSSFVDEIRRFNTAQNSGLTSAAASLQSHLIAFAAEQSRLSGGKPVELSSSFIPLGQ